VLSTTREAAVRVTIGVTAATSFWRFRVSTAFVGTMVYASFIRWQEGEAGASALDPWLRFSCRPSADVMMCGREIIAQGAFQRNGWAGRTDILRRVESPSDLGPWSYEVIDTKLARETKGGTVLQLCLYADLVESVQGRRPEFGYVVAPWLNYEPQKFRMDDYSAFYRRVRQSLEEFVEAPSSDLDYPEPKDHCDICEWRANCEARRRTDDHLCLVAGISKLQTNELRSQGINTVSERCRFRSRGNPSEVRPTPMSMYGSRLESRLKAGSWGRSFTSCCRLSRDMVFRCCRYRRQGMSFLILKAIRSWATVGLSIYSAMRFLVRVVD
jgi:hypothetical protein